MDNEVIDNVESVEIQAYPESPVQIEAQNVEIEISEEELGDMPREAKSPEMSEVKEPEFIPDIEAKLIVLAEKADISIDVIHTHFHNILNCAINTNATPIEKQYAALSQLLQKLQRQVKAHRQS